MTSMTLKKSCGANILQTSRENTASDDFYVQKMPTGGKTIDEICVQKLSGGMGNSGGLPDAFCVRKSFGKFSWPDGDCVQRMSGTGEENWRVSRANHLTGFAKYGGETDAFCVQKLSGGVF